MLVEIEVMNMKTMKTVMMRVEVESRIKDARIKVSKITVYERDAEEDSFFYCYHFTF